MGYFKGAIKVYPLPDDGSPDPPKVLSNIPSSKPVKVVVRIYIIKVSQSLIAISLCIYIAGRVSYRILSLGGGDVIHHH